MSEPLTLQDASSSSEHRRLSLPLLAGSILCMAGMLLLVWRGSLDGAYVFDDYANIVHNRDVRSLWNWSALRDNSRPFGSWTFAANYAVGGLDRRGFHIVNLLIHVLNAVLLSVGVLLAGLVTHGGRASPLRLLMLALFCGLLWGVHPLTTQGVTYIVQRYESLAALGYLLAWVSLLLVAHGWRWANLLMLVGAWIGLLSKETMATAPLTLLIFDRLWLAASWREILRQRGLTYLFLLSPWVWFSTGLVRWFDPTHHSSMGFGLQSVTPWEYLRTQPEILLHYLRLTLWPSDLIFDYVWRVQHNPWIYIGCGLAIVAALIAGILLAWRKHLAGFLILAFFLVLAPTSSFMPIADLAVEHRMYLPSAIVVVGLILAANELVERASRGKGAYSKIVPVVAVTSWLLLVGAGSWRTHLRNLDYRDGIVLWTKNLEARPKNPRAHYMLGTEWHQREQYQKAFQEFSLARKQWLGGDSGSVFVGLGDCLREFGRHDEAIEVFRHAIKCGLSPLAKGQAHNRIGYILHRRGQLAEARQAFAAACTSKLPEAEYNLADVMIDLGEEADAIPILERMTDEFPDFPRAPRRLAWILSTSPDELLRDGRRALELVESRCRPEESASPHVWDTLAAAYAEMGDFAAATRAAAKAEHLASGPTQASLLAAIRRRHALYQSRQPFRDTERRRDENVLPAPLSGREEAAAGVLPTENRS